VVVYHPHHLYGGDMDNKVVLAICSNLSSQGIIALRFNYRGVDTNLGAYKDGKVSLTSTEGEIKDAIALWNTSTAQLILTLTA
jgi:alpha/beta superfamily hydrolase